MQRFFCTLALCSLVFVVGCGGNVVITGTAATADGTPITQGTVTFTNAQGQFSGDIQPNGTFRPGRMRDGDGIPPGHYQVFVTGVVREVPGTPDLDPEDPRFRYATFVTIVHPRYSDPATSGLSIDTAQTKTLNLVLDPAE